MNIRTFGPGDDLRPETVAAVMAAVEALLEEEAAHSQPRSAALSAWRMAVAGRGASRGFGANVSWRGRD